MISTSKADLDVALRTRSGDVLDDERAAAELRAEKTRETRLRRMAERQGFKLMKSRTRDGRALDYGRWWVVDPNTNGIVAGEPGYMDIDGVERFLLEDD